MKTNLLLKIQDGCNSGRKRQDGENRGRKLELQFLHGRHRCPGEKCPTAPKHLKGRQKKTSNTSRLAEFSITYNLPGLPAIRILGECHYS
jgi:hypothetical protein